MSQSTATRFHNAQVGSSSKSQFQVKTFCQITSRTCCSTDLLPSPSVRPPIKARYCISILVLSVLPAPLSPLTRIAWLIPSFIICLHSHFLQFVRQLVRKIKKRKREKENKEWQRKDRLPVCRICNGERVWIQFPESHPFVLVHHTFSIQMRQSFKRVYRYQYTPSVCLVVPQ